MKKIFLLLSFVLPLLVFGQTLVRADLDAPYYQGSVKVKDTLGVESVFILNGEMITSFTQFLEWSDTTLDIATKFDLFSYLKWTDTTTSVATIYWVKDTLGYYWDTVILNAKFSSYIDYSSIDSIKDGNTIVKEADLLDGQHGTYFLDRINHTGDFGNIDADTGTFDSLYVEKFATGSGILLFRADSADIYWSIFRHDTFSTNIRAEMEAFLDSVTINSKIHDSLLVYWDSTQVKVYISGLGYIDSLRVKQIISDSITVLESYVNTQLGLKIAWTDTVATIATKFDLLSYTDTLRFLDSIAALNDKIEQAATELTLFFHDSLDQQTPATGYKILSSIDSDRPTVIDTVNITSGSGRTHFNSFTTQYEAITRLASGPWHFKMHAGSGSISGNNWIGFDLVYHSKIAVETLIVRDSMLLTQTTTRLYEMNIAIQNDSLFENIDTTRVVIKPWARTDGGASREIYFHYEGVTTASHVHVPITSVIPIGLEPSGSAGSIQFVNGDSTKLDGDTSFVYINGNVGIGTANPTTKLEVNGNITVNKDVLKPNIDINFYEEFIGAIFSEVWALNGTGATFTLYTDTNGSMRCQTAAVSGRNSFLDWGYAESAGVFKIVPRTEMTHRRLNEETTNMEAHIAMLYHDVNNNIGFRYASAESANFRARVRVGGVNTYVDTGIPSTPVFRKFQIVTDNDSCLFFINDVQVAAIATPAGLKSLLYQPRIGQVETTDGVSKGTRTDYVLLTVYNTY